MMEAVLAVMALAAVVWAAIRVRRELEEGRWQAPYVADDEPSLWEWELAGSMLTGAPPLPFGSAPAEKNFPEKLYLARKLSERVGIECRYCVASSEQDEKKFIVARLDDTRLTVASLPLSPPIDD